MLTKVLPVVGCGAHFTLKQESKLRMCGNSAQEYEAGSNSVGRCTWRNVARDLYIKEGAVAAVRLLVEIAHMQDREADGVTFRWKLSQDRLHFRAVTLAALKHRVLLAEYKYKIGQCFLTFLVPRTLLNLAVAADPSPKLSHFY
jgi:hypothetical protein